LTRRSLAIAASYYGLEYSKVAIRLNNMARLLQATIRLAEAEAMMRKSLEIIFHFCVNCGHLHPNF
jgi:DNA replicative helicase MCM subunit Mcm2 (Cdc46/Mcm family)